MDSETRTEINAMHSRINEAISRIVAVETNYVHIDKKLSKIEGSTTWLLRTVLGVVILIVVRFFLSGGLGGVL